MKNGTLIIAETFYSIQGEGPTTGIPAIFIRLGGCNLVCGRNQDDSPASGAAWECDTIDVWRKGKRTKIEDLVKSLDENFDLFCRLHNGAHVVITGGEPLMQDIAPLMAVITSQFFTRYPGTRYVPFFEVETNGTIRPGNDVIKFVSQWNVSPKLKNSGQPESKRINPEAIADFVKLSNYGGPLTPMHGAVILMVCVYFKFVVSSFEDFYEVQEVFLQPFKIDPQNVVLMPAAGSLDELKKTLPVVAEICKTYVLRMTSRAQIEIWNQTTGV